MGSGQDGMRHESQLSMRTGGRDAQDSQPIDANLLANHRPHHTGVGPNLRLARALRLGKYPLSKIFCAKVTRQVIICNERYNAMGRYLSVV
jgi:hypothetical protein